jgi:alpha-L-rhamnosidase
VYGHAGIHWREENGRFLMHVRVPVGSKATVYVPSSQDSTVLENGTQVTGQPFIHSNGWADGYRVFKVESGDYYFEVVR